MSFEGAVDEIDLVQRLVELGRDNFTGAIRFEQDGIIKIVYFKGGDVLSASTNDRKDAVDEILLRAGKVSKEHVKQALAKRKESETLGDALLNLGFITRKELTWARRVQVIGILRSVRSWTNGTYAIVPDYLPKREEGTLFPLQQIIVEFIVTEQDRQTFDRAMDGGDAVFRKTSDFDGTFDKLGLNDEAVAIVSQIDGSRSAAEIASTTGEDTFNVYKLLEALRILGVIEKPVTAEKPQAEDELGFASAGVADAADAWSAPEPQPMSFDSLDSAPELAMPPMDIPDPAPEPTVEPVGEPAPKMPQWEFEEERKIPFALTMSATSTASAAEPEWGFDEAQIEAANRAAGPLPVPNGISRPGDDLPSASVTPTPVPFGERKRVSLPPPKPPREKKGVSTAFGLIVSLLLAGILAGAWMWWKGRNEAAAPVASAPRMTPPAVTPEPIVLPPDQAEPTDSAPPAQTLTIAQTVPSTTAAPTTTMTSAPARTATTAPTSTAPLVAARLERTTTATVITNTPAAPDANRGRYDALARQHAQNTKGNYTVQFELVCQAASVGKAVAAGGDNVWFIPTTYRGQPCYRVFWGRFDTRDAAIAAIERIPPQLRGSTPVVIAIPKS